MHRDVSFDFAELLMEVLQRRASDLHVTAGQPPVIRVRGRLVPLEDYPVLTHGDTREIIYSILTNDQRQRLETDWQLDFAYADPRRRPLPRQRVLPAPGDRRRVPPDPAGDPEHRRPRPAGGRCTTSPRSRAAWSSSPARPARASRPRSPAMIDEINAHARGAHPHDRGPDRVPPHAQEVHRQPARDRLGRAVLRHRAEGRAAPGPRRDPRRRDARPGDDLTPR